MKLSDEQESVALSVYDCLAMASWRDDVVCVTVCVGVLALCRLTHDISLNEYEDDDLSEVTEITDENGITLCQLDLNPKVSLYPQINLLYRF